MSQPTYNSQQQVSRKMMTLSPEQQRQKQHEQERKRQENAYWLGEAVMFTDTPIGGIHLDDVNDAYDDIMLASMPPLSPDRLLFFESE